MSNGKVNTSIRLLRAHILCVHDKWVPVSPGPPLGSVTDGHTMPGLEGVPPAPPVRIGMRGGQDSGLDVVTPPPPPEQVMLGQVAPQDNAPLAVSRRRTVVLIYFEWCLPF